MQAARSAHLVAGASLNSAVLICDAASGAVLRILPFSDTWVESVAWSTDGTQLASGSDDGAVRVWDAGP